MQKSLGLLFVLLLAVALGACAGQQGAAGGAAVPAQPSTAEPAQPIEVPDDIDVSTVEGWGALMRSQFEGDSINLLVGAHPAIEAMRGFYRDFVDITGIDVNFRIITDGTVISVALLEAASGAGNYDIFAVDAASIPAFWGRQIVVPLEAFLEDEVRTPAWFDYEDIIPAFAQGISRSQGRIIGIPYAGETRFLGYRTDLFEEHGKEPPRTMDEFLELARYFNNIEPGLFGVSMRAASGRQGGSGFQSIAYAFTDSAFVNPATFQPEFDSPETTQAIQFFVDLLENAPPDVSTFAHEEALSAFTQGITAMWLDATALAGRIVNPETSLIYDRVNFVPTPMGPKGMNAALAGWNFTLPVDSANHDQAWAFIVYMASRENARTYFDNGGVPSRTSLFTDPDLIEQNWTLPRQLEAMDHALGLIERGISYNPDFTYTNDMMDIAGTFISMALVGQISVEEAARLGQLEMLDFLADRE